MDLRRGVAGGIGVGETRGADVEVGAETGSLAGEGRVSGSVSVKAEGGGLRVALSVRLADVLGAREDVDSFMTSVRGHFPSGGGSS